MYRLSPAIASAALLYLAAQNVTAQEQPALREALALQEALRDAIRQAEPSIACILVSRSDAYKRLFHDEPPADSPGKLGFFHAARSPQPQPLRGPRRFAERMPPQDESQKYDLSHPEYVPEAYGSGVVIDGAKLLILTNYHVVRDATKIYVRLPGNKGSYADIHAADPRSDLAMLRLINEHKDIQSLKEIRMGDGGRVHKGDFVVVLANPFAAGFRDGSPSASWGIVSGLRRRAAPLTREEEQRIHLPLNGTLIQTDARLNLGCSGGALLNLRGEMIGLTTARAAITGSETAGGFAVPMDANMKRIVDKLRSGLEVEYGFLGVAPHRDGQRGDGVQIEDDEHRGAVTQGSPASRAGLRPGDRIRSINGTPLHDVDDLFFIVGTSLAGTEARLEIEGRSGLVRAELAKFYVPGKIIATTKPPAPRGIRVDYTSVLFMQMQTQRAFASWHGILPGVYVREVVPGSPAADARLKVNEVITHVNGQPVNSPAEFYRAVDKLRPSAPLELTLATSDWRGTTSTALTIP